MNSQVLLAVSQIHQQELRQAAQQARLVRQPRRRTRFALPRHLGFTARSRQTVPAISTQPRAV
ncbi:MAG TPA: hypothetical protein VGF70_13170 [Solirubrobacteraceae bacterium]